jgi:hypothetical protein
VPEEDFHLSDQTRFQAHWEARSARRLAVAADRQDRRPEDASHIRTAIIPIQSRANHQAKIRKRIIEIEYLAMPAPSQPHQNSIYRSIRLRR